MPIDLTTVPEGSSGRSRSRRRKHRDRTRKQIIIAIASGLSLFLVLGVWLLFQNESLLGRGGLRFSDGSGGGSVMPGDPIPAEKLAANPTVISAAALDSGDIPESKAMAKILAVRRVRGADNLDYLQVEYDFVTYAQAPTSYVIAVRTPVRTGHVAFTASSARRDVVEMSMVLNRLGTQGPIEVWIETIFPSNDRVSNIMKLP